MTRWVGSKNLLVRGDEALSHPKLGSYISQARKLAGALKIGLDLGQIWYGSTRERIADDAVATVTLYNNFPAGVEPIVKIILDIERGGVEEEEEPPRGIVLTWPEWAPAGGFRTLLSPDKLETDDPINQPIRIKSYVHSADHGEEEVFPGFDTKYKRFYKDGIKNGLVDWQGRGADQILTWTHSLAEQTVDTTVNATIINLRASRDNTRVFEDNKVWMHSEVIAELPSQWAVYGAAIAEGVDGDVLRIVAQRITAIPTAVVGLFERPLLDQEAELVLLQERELPTNPTPFTALSNIVFNASGTEAAGLILTATSTSGTSGTVAHEEPWDGVLTPYKANWAEIFVTPNGITFSPKETTFYSVFRDRDDPVSGYEFREFSGATLSGNPVVDKMTIAIDYKGDTLTRATATQMRDAEVTEYNYQESIDDIATTKPGSASGSYSGSGRDVLVEFENSSLPSFYGCELVSNSGSYLREWDENGVTINGNADNDYQAIQRFLNYLDLRYDTAIISEALTDSTISKPTFDSFSATREVSITRRLYRKGVLASTMPAEPSFIQSHWGGVLDDPDRDPEMGHASQHRYGCMTNGLLFTTRIPGGAGATADGKTEASVLYMYAQLSPGFAFPLQRVPAVRENMRAATLEGKVEAFLFGGSVMPVEADGVDVAFGEQLMFGVPGPDNKQQLNIHLEAPEGLGPRFVGDEPRQIVFATVL